MPTVKPKPAEAPRISAADLLHALSDAQHEASTLRAFLAAFGPRAGFYAAGGDLLFLDVEGVITIWRGDTADRYAQRTRLQLEHRRSPHLQSLLAALEELS